MRPLFYIRVVVKTRAVTRYSLAVADELAYRDRLPLSL